jgi:imidazolonepropionase-like amidohydrolase
MMLLIENVTLFTATDEEARPGMDLLCEGERIAAIGPTGSLEHPADLPRLGGPGTFVLPGIIDCHTHVMLSNLDIMTAVRKDLSFNIYEAAANLRATLEAGVTSARDLAGADRGIRTALERGLISGPRLKIAICILSQTGGHSDQNLGCWGDVDYFFPYPGRPPNVVDGVDAVRQRVREVFRAGADLIKICTTGGVASPGDHPDHVQFSEQEIRAIVEEADARGRIVAAHAQGSRGVKNALRNGVRSIEHGFYLDEECVELMVTRGAYFVPTLYVVEAFLAGELGELPDYMTRKAAEARDAHLRSIELARKAGVRIAMGTDCGAAPHGQNLCELGAMERAGMRSAEVLIAATRTSAALLGIDGETGTLEAGKLADLLVVNKDPLAGLGALADPDNIEAVVQGGHLVRGVAETRSAAATVDAR